MFKIFFSYTVAKEIGIQRRKQYPELANRSSEVMHPDAGQHSKDVVDLRARVIYYFFLLYHI